MSTTQRVLVLVRSAFVGWVAMLVILAGYEFLLPHRIQSEIGPFGAFLVFGLALSAVYLANFLIITVPVYFLSLFADKDSPVRHWVRTLCGAGLYVLSVVLWCSAYNTHADWILYMLAATAGAASVYALSFQERR